MGATARMPVYLRVGNGTERPIGSVLVAPAAEDAELPSEGQVAVRIVGGQLTVAELLEQAATELRRRHAEQTTGHAGATVLLASTAAEAARYREAHPDRWTDVHVVTGTSAAVFEGMRVHSVDITDTVDRATVNPRTRRHRNALDALDVLRQGMAMTANSTGHVTVLHDAGDGTT
ncbi:hypothetical protein ACVDFE_02170 [Lentzea chajnantorensis]